MKIKFSDTESRNVTQFDLLGEKETALCKAFAYTLADKEVFSLLMPQIFGITYAGKYFKGLSIDTEIAYDGLGRTDIELKFGDHRIIIEAKIGNNTIVGDQLQKYADCFDGEKYRYLCFLTNNVPPTKVVRNLQSAGIKIVYLDWAQIVDVLSRNKLRKATVEEFINYYEKGYEMRNIKEIAVRDISGLSKSNFKNFNIIQSQPVVGKPLYFSPYFTRRDNDGEEGFTCISPVLGVVTAKAEDVTRDLLKTFTDDEVLIEKWERGIGARHDTRPEEFTFFFLGDSTALPKPLLKDGGSKKGRGKGWVAAMIPKGKTISFSEFIRRLGG